MKVLSDIVIFLFSSYFIPLDLPSLKAINISNMSEVRINGVVIRGNSITMNNGVLMVDGVAHSSTAKQAASHLTIQLTGSVSGNVSSTSGDITISDGDIHGSASSVSGDVKINGNVGSGASSISGDVTVQGQLITGRATSISGRANVKKSPKLSITEVKEKQQKPTLTIPKVPVPVLLKKEK